MKSIYLIIITLLFVNCSQNQTIELPKWYINPPQNDSIKLYGVGYGMNIQNAEQNALDNLAQKIVVNISSSMETLRQESSYNNQSNYSESSLQSVKSKVKKISFMNFTNEKSVQVANQIYTLVSIDRSNLIRQYDDKISQTVKQIDQIIALQKYQVAIEKKAGYLKIEKLIAKAEDNLIILDSISINKTKITQYKNKFNQLSLDHANIDNNLSIYVEHDQNSQLIADVITSEFAKNNIKINTEKTNSSDEVLIKISSTETKQFLYGSYLIKSEINLAFRTNKNQIIKNSLMRLSGSSSISYEEAKINLSKKLAKKINDSNNIFNQLGFN